MSNEAEQSGGIPKLIAEVLGAERCLVIVDRVLADSSPARRQELADAVLAAVKNFDFSYLVRSMVENELKEVFGRRRSEIRKLIEAKLDELMPSIGDKIAASVASELTAKKLGIEAISVWAERQKRGW